MKSKPSNVTVWSLKQLRRDILRISDEALLDALSRGIEENNSKDTDSIGRAVELLSKCIREASELLSVSANVLKYVQTKAPEKGRVSEIEDCLRCKQPALPHPISGFCSDCNKLWKSSGHEDRASFIASGILKVVK